MMSLVFPVQKCFGFLSFQVSWSQQSTDATLQMFKKKQMLVVHTGRVVHTNRIHEFIFMGRSGVFCFSDTIKFSEVVQLEIFTPLDITQ